jgi:hypothetical protein
MSGTELYDLFGESGFCTVCQEELKEGERVRTIQKCQHLFHASCLEPWLADNTTCPVCRTPIYTRSQVEIIQNLLTALEERIIRHRVEYARNVLTWTLIEGVLRKCTNAAQFNEQLETLQHYLQEHPVTVDNTEAHSIEIRNRSHAIKDLSRFRKKIYEGSARTSIRGWQQITDMRGHLERYAVANPTFLRIWI